jgi:hypothetical protein
MHKESEDELPEVIKVGPPGPELICRLEKIAGMVADFHLLDESRMTGVVLGISSSAVILDLWDEERRRPKGEPWLLDFSEIATVVIP